MIYNYIFISFISIVVLYYILYVIDYYTGVYTNPVFYKNLNIKPLHKYDFDYLKKNHGHVKVVATESLPDHNDIYSNYKMFTLKDYCNAVINKTLSPNWYLKSEDIYDLLTHLNIKEDVIKYFNQFFKKPLTYDVNTSFWMGSKNSTTAWHTDLDDLSYLYVIKGKKKITLVSPAFNHYMYEDEMFIEGSRWSNINFKNVDYNKYPNFKKVKKITYILNEGDCIYIPRNWWHCVENLEDSIAITYKIFRFFPCLSHMYIAFIQKIHNYLFNYRPKYHVESYMKKFEEYEKNILDSIR